MLLNKNCYLKYSRIFTNTFLQQEKPKLQYNIQKIVTELLII